jgi:hypothetical protein
MAMSIKVTLGDGVSVTEAKRLIAEARKLGDVFLGPQERRWVGEQTPEEALCAAMTDAEVPQKLQVVVSRQRERQAAHRGINVPATIVLDGWSADGELKN